MCQRLHQAVLNHQSAPKNVKRHLKWVTWISPSWIKKYCETSYYFTTFWFAVNSRRELTLWLVHKDHSIMNQRNQRFWKPKTWSLKPVHCLWNCPNHLKIMVKILYTSSNYNFWLLTFNVRIFENGVRKQTFLKTVHFEKIISRKLFPVLRSFIYSFFMRKN